MPEVKGKGKKKKAAAAPDPGAGETPGPDAEEGGAKKKKKKKKKEKPSDCPEVPPLMVGFPMSAEEAQKDAKAWRAGVVIARKTSVGTLATNTYDERVATFGRMNPQDQRSSVFPLNNYIGDRPDPDADPFTRDKFGRSDGGGKKDLKSTQPEALSHLQRQPKGVLNNENLINLVNSETTRITLENAYWLPK